MRRAWFFVLPLVWACAGKNVVAGDERTQSEQLADALPAWCRQACEKIVACSDDFCDCSGDSCSCTSTDVAECLESCEEELKRYTTGGDTCAAIGRRFEQCVDGLSCEAFATSKANDCEPTEAEQSKCPRKVDEPGASQDDPPPSTVSMGAAGSAAVGATGAGGSSGDPGGGALGGFGAGGTTGGTAPSEPPSCPDSYGLGGTGNDAGLVCEEGRLHCSDGHDYGWMCARGANVDLACSCFFDGQLTKGFDPLSKDCPSLARVNEACGFALER